MDDRSGEHDRRTGKAGEEFDPSLNKADASLKIDALQHTTVRGRDH